jgi:hypothetical protein
MMHIVLDVAQSVINASREVLVGSVRTAEMTPKEVATTERPSSPTQEAGEPRAAAAANGAQMLPVARIAAPSSAKGDVPLARKLEVVLKNVAALGLEVTQECCRHLTYSNAVAGGDAIRLACDPLKSPAHCNHPKTMC